MRPGGNPFGWLAGGAAGLHSEYRTMRCAWLFVGVLLLSVTVVGQEPSAPPVFRGGTEVIQLDVSVLDDDRMPIRGLTAADFTVLVDGQPQPIVAFDAVNLPTIDRTRAAWTREVAPDVATNRQDAQRVVVILFDNCSIAPEDGPLAKHIARTVVAGLGPLDRSAVVYTGWRDRGQEFTMDHALLSTAIERFASLSGSGLPAVTAFTRNFAGSGLNMPPLDSSLACTKGAGDTAANEALRNTAAVLKSAAGVRKSLVLIGSRPQTVAQLANFGVMNRLQETFAALQLANVTVYQYDPGGLRVRIPSGYVEMFGEFADNTGGRAITNTNAPESLVPQMFRENSSYYVLGIEAGPATNRPRYRRVQVRVSRPDVDVRTRSGFFAPKGERDEPAPRNAPTPLERALSNGLPDNGLPMTLAAAPFANPDRKAATVLLVTGLDAADVADGQEVELDIRAFKTDWKEAATTASRAVVTRRNDSAQAEFTSSLTLPPGRYEVRAAMRHPATGRTGSAYATVIVPDFGKEPLSMSGVVLSPATAGSTALTGRDAADLPAAPTTVREFHQADRLELIARIYQGGKKTMALVELNARVVDDADRTLIDEVSRVPAADFGPGRQATYQLELPVRRLMPGSYLLVVEATAGANVTRRNVRFTVRPDDALAP